MLFFGSLYTANPLIELLSTVFLRSVGLINTIYTQDKFSNNY